MFQESDVAQSDRGDVDEQRIGRRRAAALGTTVARLCAKAATSDVVVVACSEQRGEAIARAAEALSDALVLWVPPSDALPGEDAPASPAVAGRRVAALAALHARGDRHVLLVTDAAGAAEKVAPPAAFRTPPCTVAAGEPLDGDAFATALEAIGYFGDDRVDEAGEIAVRGGTIDVFPADAERPVRIHLEDGRVDRISSYDPVTQAGTGEQIERLDLRPAAEPDRRDDAVTLFDHLPGAAAALDPEAEERRDRFLDLVKDAGGKGAYTTPSEWALALKGRATVDMAEGAERPGTRFVELRNSERAFRSAILEARDAGTRILVAGSARDIRFVGRRIERRLGEVPRAVERWSEVLEAPEGALMIAAADIERGWTAPGLMVVATADLLGARALDSSRGTAIDPLSQDLVDFHHGDAVIHEDHGLGILRGIDTISAGDVEGDAIRIEYATEAQRLVPVEEAGRLWRYGAEAEVLTLDRLDGTSWERRRSEIDETIASTARQLIALAEERARRTAASLEPRADLYERFSAGFPYTETADQIRAIEAVRTDLASGKPMDRLVVGDVGYGKTEVALRAAAVALLSGKQVALVAPTTVLVRQHVATFAKRFRQLGIAVAGLSRLSSSAEAQAVKKGLADGSIRMVVGTQAIAGKGVSFADLGLVIIDEEQRFGAADKRKLRSLGADVHGLTLTATPIPRTLQSALVGLQDLSLIATPPARRLPTRTSVATFSAERVRPALLRERRRGGQSFVVVPRIEDMAPMAERLRRLVPDLTLRQAHGKMPAAEIDEEMIRFSAGDGDILLATNIIEAGLDIPRANTMIIWRADRFGLAQLHQLRGRVGRGRARGYLLLLTDAENELAPATLKRLRTMETLDMLGAGFAISARDLDLRGAGELLGEEQAGHIKRIGLGLYQHLLGQALRTARGERVEDWLPELQLGMPGRIPESWIPEEEVRINLYTRLARLASVGDLDAFAEEIEDRFGRIPDEAATLIESARLRQLARDARIARIDAGPGAIALTPRRDFAGNAKGNGLVSKGDRLLLQERIEESGERAARLRELLESLSGE